MKQGFTLVETLVAITILLIGVLGPITVLKRGINEGLYAHNQLIAAHLAQEALELVNAQIERNNRDPGRDPATTPFWNGLSACKVSENPAGCGVVIRPNLNIAFEFKSCNDAEVFNCQVRYKNTSESYEPYDSSQNANFSGLVFTRKLGMTTSGKEAIVTATVSWYEALLAGPKTINLSLYVFDVFECKPPASCV